MNRIKALLEQHNMTQKQLALVMRVSQPTVSDWIAGRKNPSAERTRRLADHFDVSIDYLLGRSDEPSDGRSEAAIPEDDGLIALYGEVKPMLDQDDLDDIALFMRMKAARKKEKARENEEKRG